MSLKWAIRQNKYFYVGNRDLKLRPFRCTPWDLISENLCEWRKASHFLILSELCHEPHTVVVKLNDNFPSQEVTVCHETNEI